MSKSTLTAMLAQRHGLTEDASRAIVDDVFFYIERALKETRKRFLLQILVVLS